MLEIILDEKKINQLFSFLKTLVTAIMLVYLTGFMSLCSPFCNISYDNRVPPDDELIKTFKENREDFELLVDMALEDAYLLGISRIALGRLALDSFRERNPDIPKERGKVYQKLFKKLKIEDGLRINEDAGEVKLHPLGRKVYIYSKKRLEPVYKSLDGLEKIDLNSQELIYRKLDEHWYLYYDPDRSWF